jgi:hypothetical protein
MDDFDYFDFQEPYEDDLEAFGEREAWEDVVAERHQAYGYPSDADEGVDNEYDNEEDDYGDLIPTKWGVAHFLQDKII